MPLLTVVDGGDVCFSCIDYLSLLRVPVCGVFSKILGATDTF